MNNETQDAEQDPRTKQVEDRKALMKKLNPALPRVRVNPKDDVLRKALKHPNGVAFPESGSVEWPLDQFTRRRLKEGSVTKEEAEQTNEREQRSGDRDRRRPRQSGSGEATLAEPKPSSA